MKTTWTKETPAQEGWYWIKYRGKHGTVKCPCYVCRIEKYVCVHTARHDVFHEGPNHGGPGLKYDGKLDKSIRFGPSIEIPLG